MTVRPAGRGFGALTRVERIIAASALLLAALLPVVELLLRALFDSGIPGSTGYVQNLALWIAFLGAMAASREGAHLALATGEMLPPAWQRHSRVFTNALSAAVAAALAWASLDFVRSELESPGMIGGWLPQWVVEAILPFAFAVIAFRFFLRAGGRRERGIALLGLLALAVALWIAPAETAWVRWAGSRCWWWRCRSARRSSSCSAASRWCSSTPRACRSPRFPSRRIEVSCRLRSRRCRSSR